MLLIRVLILLVLLLIFVQDVKSRSVYWVLFPLLIVLFIISDLIGHKTFDGVSQPVLFNTGFLCLQLLIITCWFSLKAKKWINIAVNLLGWGDILFLTAIGFYLSFINYLFFYIISLIFTLSVWLIWQFIANNKGKYIPLAGIQAFALMGFLSADWWIFHFDATKDYWLLHFLIK
jgi:hypothetical protein